MTEETHDYHCYILLERHPLSQDIEFLDLARYEEAIAGRRDE